MEWHLVSSGWSRRAHERMRWIPAERARARGVPPRVFVVNHAHHSLREMNGTLRIQPSSRCSSRRDIHTFTPAAHWNRAANHWAGVGKIAHDPPAARPRAAPGGAAAAARRSRQGRGERERREGEIEGGREREREGERRREREREGESEAKPCHSRHVRKRASKLNRLWLKRSLIVGRIVDPPTNSLFSLSIGRWEQQREPGIGLHYITLHNNTCPSGGGNSSESPARYAASALA